MFDQPVSRKVILLLACALLVGLLARLPGVWWGSNFPSGWYGHHPDEYTHVLNAQHIINPYQPKFDAESSHAIGLNDPWAAGYSVTPYPKGMAAHVSVPVIAYRVLTGKRGSPPPPSAVLIPLGRLVSVLYGTATILVVFLLARRLFREPAVALLAAWLMALGGLHVTQSHFFLADVPALFWFLLGTLLLWYDLEEHETGRPAALAAAAFCFGIAFGMKLLVAAFPSLGLAAILRKHRLWRVALVIAFTQFGIYIVNLGFYTPRDFYDTVSRGVADPFLFSKFSSTLLYIVELPSLVSLPLFIAAVVGAPVLAAKLLRRKQTPRRNRILLIVLLPLTIHLALVVFKLDHFPRHLIPFIPWLVLVAALSFVRLARPLYANHRHAPRTLYIAVAMYLAVFVYDGEKGFLAEPRNAAANWIHDNVKKGSTVWWYYHGLPEYKGSRFPGRRPDVIAEEMHHANHYLSGMGLRDSLPRDYRYVFDMESQAQVDGFQALFTGDSEYRETVRFSENYFMPEYTLTDRLIGNRSRNYLAEVVIFINGNTSPTIR